MPTRTGGRFVEKTQPDRQWRSSSFQESKKVRVSRDLWPRPWPWAHPGCTLTWSPSCASLVAMWPFVCEKKRFAQKFTDSRTDRRRTPRHCITSFLEWAKNVLTIMDMRSARWSGSGNKISLTLAAPTSDSNWLTSALNYAVLPLLYTLFYE